MAWSCRAAAQFSVVSCIKSGECLLKRGELDSFEIYTANHEKILKEMTREDFAVSWENYMDNCSEITKMGAEAMEELSERHDELSYTE
uniref:Gla domain-containing protein n=1 Tax=Globodera pallida TaxID=36090 RepID=A0A183C573_GLOPA